MTIYESLGQSIDALQRYNGDDEAYQDAHRYGRKLKAERDALRAYAKSLELKFRRATTMIGPTAWDELPTVYDLRTEHGVMEILRDE